MSSSTLRTVSLLAATISMGLVAGVFDQYAHSIMPGLRKTDDRTFVGAFQSIDRAIINPWFIGGMFLGAAAFTFVALLANRGERAFPWVAAALVAYAIAVVVTVAIHVPLNDALKAAGAPDRITNLTDVRARFNEGRWVAWNYARVVTSTGAFVCLAWSLVLCGRSAR